MDDDVAAGAQPRRKARAAGKFTTILIKGLTKRYDRLDQFLTGITWLDQYGALQELKARAAACGPNPTYDYAAGIDDMLDQFWSHVALGAAFTVAGVAAGGLAAPVVIDVLDYFSGNALDDQLDRQITSVSDDMDKDPACQDTPQPPCIHPALTCRPRHTAPAVTPAWVYDPSGTLTVGPYSSPLKDATVTILRSDSGRPGTWEVWDGDDYEQANPASSAGDGAYGWNVPPGFYEVAATAPGHLPAQSDPVQVLPPQTGIDLMLPDAALGSVHDVTGVGGTSPSVTVHFGTWMQADLLDSRHLTLTDGGGNAVPATVVAVDPQRAPTGPDLTKTVRVVPAPPAGAGATWSPTLTLHVAASVQDAAGRPLPAALDREVTLAVAGGGSSGGGMPAGGGSAPGGGGGAPGGGGPTPHGSSTRTSAQVQKLLTSALSLAGRKATIQQLLAHRGLATTVPAPGAGTLTITWICRGTVVAKATKTFRRAGTAKLKIALTAKGRKMLKKAKTLKVKATATFRPTGGAAQSKSRTLTLRRR